MGQIGQGDGAGGVFDPTTSSASEQARGAGVWTRGAEGYLPSSGAREVRPAVGVDETGSDLNRLLAVLVALMLACGVAAGVTVNLAPAYADDSGGY